MHFLCELHEIVPGSGREFLVERDEKRAYIAVFGGPDGPRAFMNTCPHQGRALNYAPDRFLFTDAGLLVCPHHGACFDVTDGRCVSGPCEGASLSSLELQVEADQVFLVG